MRFPLRRKFFSIALTALLAFPAAAFAESSLKMTSSAGDYIGQGQSYSYDDSNSTFSIAPNYGDIGQGINFSAGGWSLSFAALGNVPLQVGAYTNATRFPFSRPSSNGLSIYGYGRGCNTLTGEFTVKSISYESDMVSSFEADFVQHCEGGTSSLSGTIKYNITTPLCSELPITRANRADLNKLKSLGKQDEALTARIARLQNDLAAVKSKQNQIKSKLQCH